MQKESNKLNFIKKSKEHHNNKYDYSLVEYKSNKTNVKIICPIHGIFEQRPSNHLIGGCRLCGNEAAALKVRNNPDEFIFKAKKIHGDKYEYSLTNYITAFSKVKIICPTHGIFEQTPNNHLKGHTCRKCTYNLSDTRLFIEKASSIHNNKYDYSLVEYKSNKRKVSIICPTHGKFLQTPDKHLNRCYGCPSCKESKGERKVRELLITNKINFIPQHTFDNCKSKLKLPFDFYLPDLNVCLEYHGEQHYKPIKFFGGIKKFNEQQKRDKIKRNYCFKNDIKLITIKHTQRNIKRFLSRYCIL